jgi:putative copper resistance protein D
MVEAGLFLSRFLHYAALLILFGVSLFPIYTYPGRAGKLPARIERWRESVALAAVICGLLSGLSWFIFVVAGMTGTLSGAADGDALWSVLTDTSFGNVWLARLIVSAILLGLVAIRMTRVRRILDRLMVALSAGLLASLAAVGHTHLRDGVTRIIHVSADSLHLLAAGAWLGGLVFLFHLLATATRADCPDRRSEAVDAAVRFSGMGYIAVGTIIGSGLVNSWLLVDSFANLTDTAYGELLLVKLCSFGGMLALAGLNRFWLVPILIRETKSGAPGAALFWLRRLIIGEQVLGLFIILIVSALGSMDPGAHAGQ